MRKPVPISIHSVAKELRELEKAERELKALDKRFPGMGIKSTTAKNMIGYLRGVQSTIGARKAIRRRKKR